MAKAKGRRASGGGGGGGERAARGGGGRGWGEAAPGGGGGGAAASRPSRAGAKGRAGAPAGAVAKRKPANGGAKAGAKGGAAALVSKRKVAAGTWAKLSESAHTPHAPPAKRIAKQLQELTRGGAPAAARAPPGSKKSGKAGKAAKAASGRAKKASSPKAKSAAPKARAPRGGGADSDEARAARARGAASVRPLFDTAPAAPGRVKPAGEAALIAEWADVLGVSSVAGGAGNEGEQGEPSCSAGAAASTQGASADDVLSAEMTAFHARCAKHAATHGDASLAPVMKELRTACRATIGNAARVELFGSRANGLSLPGADVDACVLGIGVQNNKAGGGYTSTEKKRVVSALFRLANRLRSGSEVSKAQVISKARVPIIKLVFRNGIAADVSVGSTNGLEAVGAVLAMQREEPLLAPLVLALKAFLRARGLNEAFNGGISSYVLTLMAACHVRMARAGASARSREQPRPGGEPTLASLLCTFFTRFGGRDASASHPTFDFDAEALSLQHGGKRAKRSLVDFSDPRRRRGMLAAEDPQERGRDIGSSAHQFKRWRGAFRQAAAALRAACGWYTHDAGEQGRYEYAVLAGAPAAAERAAPGEATPGSLLHAVLDGRPMEDFEGLDSADGFEARASGAGGVLVAPAGRRLGGAGEDDGAGAPGGKTRAQLRKERRQESKERLKVARAGVAKPPAGGAASKGAGAGVRMAVRRRAQLELAASVEAAKAAMGVVDVVDLTGGDGDIVDLTGGDGGGGDGGGDGSRGLLEPPGESAIDAMFA